VAERFKFSVAYEEATLQSAVRSFVWRSQMGGKGWVSSAVAFVIAVGASFLLLSYEFNALIGAIAAVVAALILSLSTLWWMASRARQAKLAMMSEPRAEFLILDDAVEVKTDRGAGRLPWRSIRQIWKFKRVWLLMMDSNRFVTLPLADAPAEALQFLDQKVKPRSLSAA
jgi:hypothetical protein